MVSPLFTAFALIAAGRVDVPPAPPLPRQELRAALREKDAEADRLRRRR